VTQENDRVLTMESGDVRIRGVRATEVGLKNAIGGQRLQLFHASAGFGLLETSALRGIATFSTWPTTKAIMPPVAPYWRARIMHEATLTTETTSAERARTPTEPIVR
jgi:hypothetical protein